MSIDELATEINFYDMKLKRVKQLIPKIIIHNQEKTDTLILAFSWAEK